jgi:hypothetical protein
MVREIGLCVVAAAALVGLGGCYTVNAPNANAPVECASLNAEMSRLVYAYNAKIAKRRASSQGQKKLNLCDVPSQAKQQVAEMTAIVALGDQINAKQCYQQPVSYPNRIILDRIRAELARCST